MALLDKFTCELLHLDDCKTNKLINAGDVIGAGGVLCGDNEKTFKLWRAEGDTAKAMLSAVHARRGKLSNRTVLSDSALLRTLVNNPNVEKWEWGDLNGEKSPKKLDAFIENAYKELNLKGNNPLFLGVGCLKWQTAVADQIQTVISPLIIFPVKLVRGTQTSCVEIEFVDDDAYFNPCLITRFARDLPEYVYKNFPHPNGEGADFDTPVDINKLSDGDEYFKKVEEHVLSCAAGGGVFQFYRNAVIIAQYNHGDMCMYYDVRRNREKILQSALVRWVFGEGEKNLKPLGEGCADFVLPADSIQQKLINRVCRGESLIVKGPPGTGKTLTIANMLAALLAQGKSVLVASKKLSALAEVNAKLPENLRKFVMLLDYETEKQAAAVNPEVIKKELKSILRQKREYSPEKSVSGALVQAQTETTDAVLELNAYYSAVFGEGDVAGESYFDALNTYYKNDLPEVPFALPEEVAKLTRGEYAKLAANVKSAADNFEVMHGGAGFRLCPWSGVKNLKDTEGAMLAFGEICKLIEGIETAAKPFENALNGIDINAIALRAVAEAYNGAPLKREWVEKLLSCDNLNGENLNGGAEKLKSAIKECKKFPQDFAFEFAQSDLPQCFKNMQSCAADENLTKTELQTIYENGGLFFDGSREILDGEARKKLLQISEKIENTNREKEKYLLGAASVFDLSEEKNKQLLKEAYAVLSRYAGCSSPKKLDFKAKAVYKKLTDISALNGLTFAAAVDAVCAYNGFLTCEDGLFALSRAVDAAMGKRLDDRQTECLFLVLKNSENAGVSAGRYVKHVLDIYPDFEACLKNCTANITDFPLKRFKTAVAAHQSFCGLLKAVCEILKSAGIGEEVKADLELAKSVLVVLSFKNAVAANAEIGAPESGLTEAFYKIREQGGALSNNILRVLQAFADFKASYFANYYTDSVGALTLLNLRQFARTATNRNVLSAALNYYAAVESKDNALPLESFFKEYESGAMNPVECGICQTFEHSFYALAIKNKLLRLGARRNGMGKNVCSALEKYERATQKIQSLNVKKIEALCMSRIDADDSDFDFLEADRGVKTSLRALFKTRAAGILKLKKCFILSPSTASVLFRPEEFSHFDVAIIDEASQLEPVNLLPVLFRVKQCVMVGDEYQMPPISHFKIKNKTRIVNESEELTVDNDISALSLALHNNAFETEELCCHYRSNTEALIAFSQREFYPYMRTFPAAVPFGEGLGFEDIYVENGACEGGVNAAEAAEVLNCVNAHFDKYFDNESGKLTRSLGVVAFGEAQLDCILSLVNKDTKLYKKIERAKLNFDDVDEKLIFFKTIESVQGQETENLILSLTYGKDKNGVLRLTFGELNRDALGKNIFNVAVTRAKSKVTVIHSVTPEQLAGNPRVAFIKDYLTLSAKFSQAGRGQFVFGTPDRGKNFIDRVVKFIVSCGYEKERVVVNYGVTEGSVKIPVAVLSKDLSRAELGIWCEQPVEKRYDFFDYNLSYYRSLQGRGWNLYRIFAHDWADNYRHEAEELAKTLKKYVK